MTRGPDDAIDPPGRDQHQHQDPATEADLEVVCASCGKPLWWDGLPPSQDGGAWICGECDAARSFDAL